MLADYQVMALDAMEWAVQPNILQNEYGLLKSYNTRREIFAMLLKRMRRKAFHMLIRFLSPDTVKGQGS